jgi:hypothetical protein
MARILDCWELGNGLAYIEGLAISAKLMAKAGHDVRFAGRELAHAERIFGGRIKYYQAPTQVIPVPPQRQLSMPMTFADVLINLGLGDAGNLTARVRAWRHLFDGLKPDVIRCANAPGALLAARGTGIRTMVMGIGSLIPPDKSPLPLLRTWAKDAKPEAMAAREQALLGAMNQALDALAAPRIRSVGGLYAETDARLLYTYPELDEYGPRDDVEYSGAVQPGMGAAPQWPDLPGKKIFAYLEPFDGIHILLDALVATRLPALVYMAHAPEQLIQRYASSNVRIVQQPLDVVKAAALCDYGVSHGGHQIAATFLHAGKPQLAVPAYFPERVIAEKITAAGMGVYCPLRGGEIAAQLKRLLQDPSLADNTRAGAARIAHLNLENSIKRALDTVERLVAAGPRT